MLLKKKIVLKKQSFQYEIHVMNHELVLKNQSVEMVFKMELNIVIYEMVDESSRMVYYSQKNLMVLPIVSIIDGNVMNIVN
jgi:hypothetical protein